MPCVPGGRSCRFSSSPTPPPPGPVPLSVIVTEPTLLPWASFTSTTVLAALASDQRMIVDDTAAMKNPWCFIATNYNQATARALFRDSSEGHSLDAAEHGLLSGRHVSAIVAGVNLANT